MRFRTLGLVGGSGGFGGLAGVFGLGAAFASAGLAAILTGEAGLPDVGLAAAADFFLPFSSFRVAFRAGLTAAGFELVADFAVCLADLVLTSADFAGVFVDVPLAAAALAFVVGAKVPLLVFVFATGLVAFPFNGLVSEFLLAADLDEAVLEDFAGLAATTFALFVGLSLVPCFGAALTDVFFFDALATEFTNHC